MSSPTPFPSARLAGWALLALLFLSAAYFHLDEALWNDEIYTLKFFVDRGLGTVLTDYHVPNNHILANVGHWLWTRLTGPLDTLLDAPWRLRLWSGLLSAGAVLVTMRAAARAWGRPADWLAGLLLLTTLAFGNFAFQIRGYPLTLLLGAGLLGMALPAVGGAAMRARGAVGVALLSAGLLYAIPSNLYYVAALGVLVPLCAGWKTADRRSTAFWWLGGVACGGALAAGLYAPVWEQVLHNEYIEAGAGGAESTGRNLVKTLLQFTSWRYLVLPLVAFGWWRLSGRASPARRQLLLLGGAVLLPFLFSALRGDTPPVRVFLVQLPAFALALTLGWSAAFDAVSPSMRRALLIGGTAVCLLGYAFAVSEARDHLRRGFDTLARDQDLNYAYYQYWYAPDREFRLFSERFPGKPIIIETAEPYDVPVYLQHYGIRGVPLDSIEQYIRTGRTMYVSTRYPKNFIGEMEKLRPRWNCSYLQSEARYPRVVICKCPPAAAPAGN